MALESVIKSYQDADRVAGTLKQARFSLNGTELGGGVNNLVVAASATTQIQVIGYKISTDKAAKFTFRSDDNVIMGHHIAANGNVIAHTADDEVPLFVTGLGELLSIYVDEDFSSNDAELHIIYKERAVVS